MSSMLLENYRPKSCLVTKSTRVLKPRFSVIDAHNHLGEEFGGGWTHRPVQELIEVLDEADIRLYFDLDGGWGEDILAEHIEKFKQAAPERFLIFGGVSWEQWKVLGDTFPQWAAARACSTKGNGGRRIENMEEFWIKSH
jgi:hypothetical protein